MVMNRVKVVWSSFSGAPGYSTFYINSTVLDPTPIRTFFDSLKAYIPTGTIITTPGLGDTVDEATGLIIGTWVGTTPATVTCTGSVASGYSAASGFVVEWLTGTVINGRRPLGKTYIVPAAPIAYATDGTLSTTPLAAFQTAATALTTALGSDFKVWHRPVAGAGGVAVAVVGSRIPDMAAVLRSRRT